MSIETKYNAWKNKLLDLGKRNRLLNYKDTLPSTVKIVSPGIDALYEQFVRNETSLIFPLSQEIFEEEEGINVPQKSNVETNKSNEDLQKALRKIRDKAKTSMEERGVNTLFLSFGFLKWTESDRSEQVFSAPILLVPAILSIESITAPFELKLHEDEIVINPTLSYKLENDFGIVLPQFDDTKSVTDYLNELSNTIAVMKNWRISKDVSLGLLSFLKINMYEDLKKHEDEIKNHPIIKAIGGDPSELSDYSEELNNYDFDRNENPIDVFQILDADSSQQDAILLAKKGVSFILQGPPGTGKSQTIANIIAESLAAGKKVLFVSEKMAALDVVYSRLSKAELDDFCLVLHSHKTQKRTVLEQLGKSLSLTTQKLSLTDEAYQNLDLLQDDKLKLNEYASQVYKKISPFDKSIYEANGIIANLECYDDVSFPIENVRQLDKKTYFKYLNLLNSFAVTVGKMTCLPQNNPWKDCNVTGITNEFFQNVKTQLPVLALELKKLEDFCDEAFPSIYLEKPQSFSEVNSVLKLIQCVKNGYQIPEEWIISRDKSYDLDVLRKELESCIYFQKRIELFRNKLSEQYSIITKEENCIFSVDSHISSERLLQDKNILLSLIAKEPFSKWNSKTINNVSSFTDEAEKKVLEYNSLISDVLDLYDEEIFNIDYSGILKRIKTEYNSILKKFNSEYKKDKKTILAHKKRNYKNISDEDMICIVEKLHQIHEIRQWFYNNRSFISQSFPHNSINIKTDFQYFRRKIAIYPVVINTLNTINNALAFFAEFENKEKIYSEHFQSLYSGIFSSDWDQIRDSLDWAEVFREKAKKYKATIPFIKHVCKSCEFTNKVIGVNIKLWEKIEAIKDNFVWFANLFEHRNELLILEFDKLIQKTLDCQNRPDLLEEKIDYDRVKKECINNGLKDYIIIVEERNITAENIVPVFKKRLFKLWLDAVLPENPAVASFRGYSHEELIQEFSRLDQIQFDIAKARIRERLINSFPSKDHITRGNDEISILKKELKKQRRVMPIRQLFQKIPNLLLVLKPCLMMSPLSVSLFLEASSYKFDIVIFDEASQVCTENAIGAIFRGKQVVIAGDSKQLPPTNFFQVSSSDDDYDEDALNENDEYYDDTDSYESILDEANMLPERTLSWHYRSRHEDLITFSNNKIYHNNLITFPSNIVKADDIGVEYIFVSGGFYDRGGRKGNAIEANKVADMVYEHFNMQPQRSLGVIAFGEHQQQAIETALRHKRRLNLEYEHFFLEENEEPFFVKNLENVQGDERDTIIFSIGYAKDANGIFRMNFGPLSKSGGERRLNVAITRAKYNVKLVGSIQPTDIKIENISSEGPKLLRTYIEFAQNGSSVLDYEITESSAVEHDSPFEESVYNYLIDKGFEVATQVGCSGYRIDLAVKHPQLSGIYVLGVECDGASYHSARTARERDRLRQDVLENMGWRIYRIWSTDWIKNPGREGQKLLQEIDTAIKLYDNEQYEMGSNVSINIENDNADHEFEKTSNDYVQVMEKVTVAKDINECYGFEENKPVDFSNVRRDYFGSMHLEDCIFEIIKAKYPLHFDLLCQEVAPLLGQTKSTVKIKRIVNQKINYSLQTKVEMKGDYLYPSNYNSIPIRMPNNRKIQHISCEELAEAMFKILKTYVGTTKADLCEETTRIYGFSRSGSNIKAAMSDAFDLLVRSNQIEEVDGKIKIKK